MRPFLLAVSLLLSSVVIADEVYLPLAGNVGGRASITALRILNPSIESTPVTIELLGTGDTPTSRQFTLAARETVELSDAITELFGTVSTGALRITSGATVRVTATSRCPECGTTTSLPLLQQAVDEGELAGSVPTNRLGWQSSILIVNPDSVASAVTLALRRGDDVVEEESVRVAAHGTRLVRIDRLFRSTTPSDVLTFRAPEPVVLFGYDVNARTGARVFTTPRSEAGQPRRRAVRFTSSIPAAPQTVALTPSKDNTLYESSNGGLSNGAGIHLFIGLTGTGAVRRALLAFDIASQIPPGSRITRATLTMRLSQTISGPHPATLHRVTADWGQGTSNAGSSSDGIGAGSQTGDATWLHTFFPNSFWTTQGGDFDAAVDATTQIGSSGSFTWASSSAMVARVQSWLDQPAANFGWLIVGNENVNSSAKRLDSRESTASARPTLTVEFTR
jgi:hypothetical protein